jgi:hypothetical protein
MQPNGTFTLQAPAASGQSLVVQVSTNLVDWVPISTNVPGAGQFIFTDTNATDSMRFYRIQN